MLCGCCVSVGVDRQGLTAFLVDEAASRYPTAITFHFNTNPTLDLTQRRVRFVSPDSNQRAGSPTELPYDLLVGADGAGSSVRATLEQGVGDVQVGLCCVGAGSYICGTSGYLLKKYLELQLQCPSAPGMPQPGSLTNR